MAKVINRAITLAGEPRVVGTPALTVLEYNTSGKVRRAEGTTVPTDGDAGFAKGCTFTDTDASASAVFYVNEGSATSADFNLAAGEAAAGSANTALSNLASVAINTSLISDTDNTDDLGSSAKQWKDIYINGVGYIDTLQTDLIQEDTSANGVVIDGLTVKDGGIAGTGDITMNTNKFTVAGATGNTVVAGTLSVTGASTLTGNVTASGTLAVTGNATFSADVTISGGLTFGGALTISDTVTVDELILDTDGTAPAGTNAYVVSDNTGDLTLNALTGKNIELAIAGTDEYSFDAAKLDFNGNAIDNAGYVILNAATAPAATEVYLANDNTGDLTLNALSTKSVHIAIAGTDEFNFSATEFEVAAGNDIQFLGNDGILDSAGNEVILVEAVGSAVNYLNVKNAATANPIILECLGTADKGFIFQNDQDEEILELVSGATALNEIGIVSTATTVRPIIRAQGQGDLGMDLSNYDGTNTEPMLRLTATATGVNWIGISNTATTALPIIRAEGEGDLGMILASHDGTNTEEILILAATATAVNEFTMTSAATTGSPALSVTGDDTDIDLTLTAKGAGDIVHTSPITFESSVGVTANVGSAQGNGAFTETFLEIAVCVNVGDAVTLPAAEAGKLILVTNRGAASADVFPASGDNINEVGADTAKALAANASILLMGIDGTHWEALTLAR